MNTGIETQELLIERRDSALWITLNRPQALNALTRGMLKDLLKTVKKSSADASLRSIVLTGNGRGFCVGADLSRFQEDSKAGRVPSFRQELEDYFHPVARAIRAAPQIVIGRINGSCAGAGLALALACDLKYALEKTQFVAAFAKVGLGPDTGSSFLVERAMGYSKALEFFLIKGKAEGDDLEKWGLINKAAASEKELDDAVLDAVRSLSELPPQAVSLTKRALQTAAESPRFEDALACEAALQDYLGKTQDHAEGMAAFLEKRKPVFKGC